MTKRFIEFMTQNSDDGELNCGFSDIVENEWYHTKDRVNAKKCVDLLNNLIGENEQLKQSNERIIKDIDLALGFIRHKGYSLQDIKDYEDAKKEYEEDLANYRKGDVE